MNARMLIAHFLLAPAARAQDAGARVMDHLELDPTTIKATENCRRF